MTSLPTCNALGPAAVDFLHRNGLGAATLTALASDASARRYVRVEGRGCLLMIDPADPAGFAGFVRLSAHLDALGLSAPRVIAQEAETGLALIEDFGSETYRAALGRGLDEEMLYALAVDVLLHLHRQPAAAQVMVPTYDPATMVEEVSLFTQWFAPGFAPDLDQKEVAAQFRSLWTEALAPLHDAPNALVLRDFHIDNLMLLPDRTGVRRCGLLDFQDGVLGDASYDLMSLLQDARRDLAPGLEDRMLARYLADAPAHLGGADRMMQRYHLLAAQRHTRIAGLFPRLRLRDGKTGYLTFLPRVLRQMDRALAAAGLQEIADLLRQTLPGWQDADPAVFDPR